MARTTTAEVKAVLEGGKDYRRDVDIAPYIDIATTIVDRLVTQAADNGLTLTAAELLKIERCLAAWAYKNSDQQLASSSNLGAGGSYTGQTGKNFESNKYGQMALMLDWTGLLRGLTAGSMMDCAWLGKARTEQLDYYQRGN
jgi:hypothetical protein